MDRPELTLVAHFNSIPDYRENHNKQHILVEIIAMAVCCTICGANAFTEIAVIANAKKEWFQSFLTLPAGIPSHDTFNRVLARINPKAIQRCFISFNRSVTSSGATSSSTFCNTSYWNTPSPCAVHSFCSALSRWLAFRSPNQIPFFAASKFREQPTQTRPVALHRTANTPIALFLPVPFGNGL